MPKRFNRRKENKVHPHHDKIEACLSHMAQVQICDDDCTSANALKKVVCSLTLFYVCTSVGPFI